MAASSPPCSRTSQLQQVIRFSTIAIIGVVGAWLIPGSVVDRALLEASLQGVINPPHELGGRGSRARPWTIRTIEPRHRGEIRRAPMVIAFDDDPAGTFESVPPSPTDLAVVMLKLRGLGVSDVALAMPMAWPDPDVFELTGLETEAGKFSSLVSSAPLTRSAIEDPLPPEFRRASLAIAEVKGVVARLPTVNRVAIPNALLGGEQALAGFSVLEAETASQSPYLVAKWDDRVVFSFAVIGALQRLRLPMAGVSLELDGFLKLSPAGPMIPVDSFGRMVRVPRRRAVTKVSAAECIDAEPADVLGIAEAPVIIRNDSSRVDQPLRAFSARAASDIAGVATESAFGEVKWLRRFSQNREVLVLAVGFVLLLAIAQAPRFARFGLWAAFTAALALVHYISIRQGFWFPSAALLAMVVTAWLWELISGRADPKQQEAESA